MRRHNQLRILLLLGGTYILVFGVLSVRQLNANAGGSWSASDMWDYVHDLWSPPLRISCINNLHQGSSASEAGELADGDSAVWQRLWAVWGDGLEDPDGFPFPDDRGGQLLSKLLPPSEKTAAPAAHDAPAPRHLPPPAHLEKPALPLPPGQVEMPRLPVGKPDSLRPRPLPEELPVFGHLTDPLVPQVQHLHTGDRVRLPSVDVNQPPPLPILAKPATLRAPLDEATADASLGAALSGTPPTRATPAPFLKLNLPDPFENRLKPATAPAEEVAPTHSGSRPAR